jgi:hypothetical protein
MQQAPGAATSTAAPPAKAAAVGDGMVGGGSGVAVGPGAAIEGGEGARSWSAVRASCMIGRHHIWPASSSFPDARRPAFSHTASAGTHRGVWALLGCCLPVTHITPRLP